MAMTNTFFDSRRCLLLTLLLSLPPSLQNGVKTNALENPQAAHVKNGPRSLMSRDLLTTAIQESALVRMEITSDEDDRPRNADKALVTALQQNAEDASTSPESASSEGSESETITKPPALHFGPLSKCYPKCVKGVDNYQEKFAICRDYLGIPIHMSECNPTKDSWDGSYTKCPDFACDRNQTVELTKWNSCPGTCTPVSDDGTVVPHTVERTYNCKKNNPTKPSNLAAKDCDPLIEELGLTLKIECPLKPCTEYRMEHTSWSKCDCDTWTRERTSRCKDKEHPKLKVSVEKCQAFGLELVDETQGCLPQKKCDGTKLAYNENSNSANTFDFCNYFNCSTHGTCEDNDCHCENNFSGHDCQWDKREADDCLPPSILQGDGTCCKSGVFNYTGYCCPGDNGDLQIDKNGECCVGELDVCGNCNPEEPEFRDIRGNCCKVLDAGGFCCPSGNVDECGLCDGLSLTCNAFVTLSVKTEAEEKDIDVCASALRSNVALKMRVSSSDLQQETVDEGRKFTFTASGVIVASGYLEKKVRSLTNGKSIKNKCGILEVTTVYRTPICGNHFCEIEEASPESDYYCPDDCPYKIARCALSKGPLGRPVVCSGHGSCSFREEAKCECFHGYSGSSCEQCQYGFFSLDKQNSRCLPRQAYINGPSYYTPPAPPPEQPSEAPMSAEGSEELPASEGGPVEPPSSPDEGPVETPLTPAPSPPPEEESIPSPEPPPEEESIPSPEPPPEEESIPSPEPPLEEESIPAPSLPPEVEESSPSPEPLLEEEEESIPGPSLPPEVEESVPSPEPPPEVEESTPPPPPTPPPGEGGPSPSPPPTPPPGAEEPGPEPIPPSSPSVIPPKPSLSPSPGDDDDDDGISKVGAIGIAFACAFVLLLLILLFLCCLSRKQAAGAAAAAGYVPVAAGPETIVAAEVTTVSYSADVTVETKLTAA